MNSLPAQTWLILRNDLRLLWRDLLASRLRGFLSISLFVVLFCILNAVAMGLFFVLRPSPPIGYEAVVWLFFAFMMLGVAMNQAVAVLFERADFDLLLPSPVSARAILLARIAGMMVGAAVPAGLLLLPMVNGAMLAVSPRYAAGYAVWLLLAGAVASAGIWFTLLLVRCLGPQRARTWAQVIATVLGASVFLIFQGRQIVGDAVAARYIKPFLEILGRPPLSFIAQAGRGELLPLCALAAIAALSIWLTTRVLGRMFIGGVQDAGSFSPQRNAGRARHYVFSGDLVRTTFWKDLRLIARDPLLLAQTLPMLLYIIPLVFIVGRMNGIGALAAASVLVAGTLSLTLAYVAASGEECWDMIRMSPANEMQLRHAKMAAGMALPLTISLAMNLVVAGLGHPFAAGLGILTSVMIAAACGRIGVTHIQPTPRRDILKNRPGGRSSPVHLSFLAAAMSLMGAAAVGLLVSGKWMFGGVLFLVCVLFVAACFTSDAFKFQRIRFSES